MDGLTRSQLARRAQMNLETIRFYEDEGLMPPAPRTSSGYRKFSEDAVERLAFVKRAKDLGFSLKEVRELLVFQNEQPTPVPKFGTFCGLSWQPCAKRGRRWRNWKRI
jgi:DNA-binding transcriptional MerR regulator